MAEEKKEVVKALPVDWNNLLMGEQVELDPTEDAWEFAAPIPVGVYDIRLFAAKDQPDNPAWGQMLADPKDKNSIYYYCRLEGKVVSDNPDLKDVSVVNGLYGPLSVSTKIGKRKAISTMAGLIVKLGYKLSRQEGNVKMEHGKVAQMFKAVLAKEPVIKVEIDWKAGYSIPGKNKDDRGEWVNVYNTYADFPDDPEDLNQKLYRTSVTGKDGLRHEINAQFFVRTFFGKNEEIKTRNNLVSAPRGKQQEVVFADDTTIVQEAPKTQQKAATAAAPESDLLLMD